MFVYQQTLKDIEPLEGASVVTLLYLNPSVPERTLYFFCAVCLSALIISLASGLCRVSTRLLIYLLFSFLYGLFN